MRRSIAMTLFAGLLLAACEGEQGPAGPEGQAGPEGPAGAAGPEGPAGPAGAPGPAGAAGPTGPAGSAGPAAGAADAAGEQLAPAASGQPAPAAAAALPGLRFVAPDSHEAWCERGEVMVSAYCEGSWGENYPLNTYSNGAKCGYSGGDAKARILCMPQSAAEAPAVPAQQGMAPAAPAEQAAAAEMEPSRGALRVVSTGSNVASCESGETMINAYCTGGWDDYPLLTYPGGRAKCGYSDGLSQASVICMPGDADVAAEPDATQPNALGLRVVSSDTNTAWCESGEELISAYCTGGWKNYPLQTYSGGAKCGYSDGGARATIVCSARAAAEPAAEDAAEGVQMAGGLLRVTSGSNVGWCAADEVMVSAYCTGGSQEYPLQTYANGAKCGYSDGESEVTLVCMQR